MPREFNTLVTGAETSRWFSLSTWKHVDNQVSIESSKPQKGLRRFRNACFMLGCWRKLASQKHYFKNPHARTTSWICLSFWLVSFLETKGEFNTSITGVDTLRVFSGNKRIPSFIFGLMKENIWNFSCAGNIINRSWRKEHLLWRVKYEVLGGKNIWN